MVKPMVKGLKQVVIELLRVLRVKTRYTREASFFKIDVLMYTRMKTLNTLNNSIITRRKPLTIGLTTPLTSLN